MASHYRLYYFNMRGRAEPIRLIFVAAGQKFNDHRFEMADWPDHKNYSPTGSCPFLEISEAERISSAHRKHSAIRTEYNEHNFTLCQSSSIGEKSLLNASYHF